MDADRFTDSEGDYPPEGHQTAAQRAEWKRWRDDLATTLRGEPRRPAPALDSDGDPVRFVRRLRDVALRSENRSEAIAAADLLFRIIEVNA